MVFRVATLRRSRGRYFPFCVRNCSRSARPSVGTDFSNPSGMIDFFDAASSSMSSRRSVCFFPSASSRSSEVFVSPASRPLRTRPSMVETVYWRKFPSTDRLGSRMWTISSLFGMRGHAGEVRADLAPLARVRVALRAFLLEDLLAARRIAALHDDRRERLDHLLAIRVGQPAPSGEQGLGPLGDLAVGVGRQCLRLVEREERTSPPSPSRSRSRAPPSSRSFPAAPGCSPCGPPGSSARSRPPATGRPRASRSGPRRRSSRSRGRAASSP